MSKNLVFAAAAALAAVLAVASPAQAVHDQGRGVDRYDAELRPVAHDPSATGGLDVTGSAKLFLRPDGELMVQLRGSGLDPLPHAIHIHGKDEGAHEIAMCPGPERRDALVDDGLIETVEGLPDYGGIFVSFTLFGDTSPASALDLGRFPVADEDGNLGYKRTITVPSDVADRLDEMHIVVHGADLDGDGSYGGRITALGAPLEAELPVACGQIRSRH